MHRHAWVFVRFIVFAILVVLASAAGGWAQDARTPRDLFASFAAGSRKSVDHSAWDRLLKTYVKPQPDGLNRVDYAAFKREAHQALKDYIRTLEAVDAGSLDRPEQFALLANLYNAKTVDIVLDHYPVASIKDIALGGDLLSVFSGGPWKAKVTSLGGVPLSLDDIEHAILRPVFKDARVHYALNCASVGCPNLRREPFTGAKLGAQLDAAARAYVNNPRGVDPELDGLVLSSIYNWYQADFGGSEAAVLDHVRRYADPPLKAALAGTTSVDDYTYIWKLNDIRR